MTKIITVVVLLSLAAGRAAAEDEVERLIAAMLSDTPIIEDLQDLTDTVGGRVTGSPANEASVAWALARFESIGVKATAEAFEMPSQWQEESLTASIDGDVSFVPGVVARPFATGTGGEVVKAPLLDAGSGTPDDYARLGEKVKGAWLLVETPVLDDEVGLAGLFAEYGASTGTNQLAIDGGAAGLVFMSSRPKNLLYRLPALSSPGQLPIVTMERENAKRALRLLREGKQLEFSLSLSLDDGYSYTSHNVIAEIPGTDKADEIVVMGAHLDSHDLGTGALDNGSNVVLMIDIARQITRLGIKPSRTIRFALWNGEEQGLVGSWKYTEDHEEELDKHVMAASFDIGTGRITGFFTGGRPDLVPIVSRVLEPVAGLGPFQQVDIPLVGTDNFDFMLEGVPNLIAAQRDANYASNYHAASDTFDKVDQDQLKLNSAIGAALAWGFANDEEKLPRHTHADIVRLIESTDLEQQMRNFGVWSYWAAGERGIQE